MKVLVLENSRLFQKLLYNLLAELGCEVDAARSGSEGVELLKNNDYGLIIASQHIFDASGDEFTQYCRVHSSDCPIMLLTSEPNERLMKSASSAGITDIFPKTNLAYLRANIRHYIQGQKGVDVAGGRVLYIEDSPSVAHIMMGYFKKLSLQVTHFENAEQALVNFLEDDFDLVITDVVLDGPMNGVAMVRMIRGQKGDKSEVPILAVTGSDDPQRRLELFRAGISDYVIKPIMEEELAARVDNLITSKRLMDHVREQQKTLFQLAMTDQLTTCHNRHCLVEYAPKYISDSIRYKFPLCIMILDLDHFKQVNDVHGHNVGDEVLAGIGELLMDSCRQGDFVARLGGEEFIILLPHCPPANAMLKAEEVRRSIEDLHPANLLVTASIGVACMDQARHIDFDGLYKAADLAVYESKETGRNRVTFEGDMVIVEEEA
ncbi:MAG: diguanylate cyclase [Methylococcales bacterium]|jgi:two-component system, cell cycle response regulator|nr:diguanylate cyclase [Methylococcales bacterium]MBT7445391.1 diguanylate cyclase [Methylococcales bacterium]